MLKHAAALGSVLVAARELAEGEGMDRPRRRLEAPKAPGGDIGRRRGKLQ